MLIKVATLAKTQESNLKQHSLPPLIHPLPELVRTKTFWITEPPLQKSSSQRLSLHELYPTKDKIDLQPKTIKPKKKSLFQKLVDAFNK